MTLKQNEIVVVKNTENNEQIQELSPFNFKIGRVYRSNCKLCNSEYRKEVEDMYDAQKRKNFLQIKRKLQEKYNFEISDVAIRNHLIFHYKAPLENESLQEYSEVIQAWMNMHTNKVNSLRARMAMLDKQLFMIGQKNEEEEDMQEKRKNAETMKKIAEIILSYEGKLDEYRQEVKPLTLIFNQLKIIVTEEMKNIDSIKTKKVLGSVLTKLQDSVGDMILE